MKDKYFDIFEGIELSEKEKSIANEVNEAADLLIQRDKKCISAELQKKINIEHVFLEFEGMPIVFACRDSTEQLYIGICAEIMNLLEIILCKLSSRELKELYKNRIALRTYLKNKEEIIYIYKNYHSKNYKIEKLAPKDLVEILPEENASIPCNHYNDSYIEKY